MRTPLILAIATLAACRPALEADELAPLAPEERQAVEVVRAVWLEHGGDLEGCDLERLRIVRDGDAFATLCGRAPRGADRECPEGVQRCAVGCFELARPEHGTALRERLATPTIAIAPELERNDATRVLVHESIHWLAWCSGADEDHWHLRADWWGDAQSFPEGGIVGEALDRLEVSR